MSLTPSPTTLNPPPPKINSQEWLTALLCDKCSVPSLRAPQKKHCYDLIQGKDLFLTMATGNGKTIVLLSPLIAAKARRETGIGILVVPTKTLAEQHVATSIRYGVPAWAINQDTVAEAKLECPPRNLFKELFESDGIRLVVLSPQMLGSKSFRHYEGIPKYLNLVRWFLIDEGHLTGRGFGVFEAPYKSLSSLRWRLKPEVIWAVVTGTVTPANALHIAQLLGFTDYVNATYSIDRPNIKYLPRILKHAFSGNQFFDISYVIPFGMKDPSEIKQVIIFAYRISTGQAVIDFLDTLLPPDLPGRAKIIQPYNSLMDLADRQAFIAAFDAGTIRVGVATDTLTYGLDTDVDSVIDLNVDPSTVAAEGAHEITKQRLSRVGRRGQLATAVTFAPPWVVDIEITEDATAQVKENAARREKLPEVVRQWYNPTETCCSRQADLGYFGEPAPWPAPIDCLCSIHQGDDEAVEHNKTIKQWVDHFAARNASRVPPLRSDQTYKTLAPDVRALLKFQLERWRARTWDTMWGPGEMLNFTSTYFLPDRIITKILDGAHRCSSLERFSIVVSDWKVKYMESHGGALYTLLAVFMTGYMEVFHDMTPVLKQAGSTQTHKQPVNRKRPADSDSYKSPPKKLKTSHSVARPATRAAAAEALANKENIPL
ncbi:P-loop containing nucleoside triphosphate hydrolase protein [Hymenopellis radicata]|nr:P-loop containing nucleoside triphosphate hydrolase protein [Hymenopellis radicata]